MMTQRNQTAAWTFTTALLLSSCGSLQSLSVDAVEFQAGDDLRVPQVRAAAPWDPALGLIAVWPPMLPGDLFVEIASDDQLYLMVEDLAARKDATEKFREWGVNMANVQFIEAPQCPAFHCASDWSPLTVFRGEEFAYIADPVFIGYSWAEAGEDGRFFPPQDLGDGWAGFPHNMDRATSKVTEQLNLDREVLDISLCNGNLLVDGHDRAFTTEIMLQESRHRGDEDEAYFELCEERLGFEEFFVLPNYEKSGAQHVTCVIKLLDEERILATRLPKDHSAYDKVEEMVAQLATLTNTFGRPYEILRIDAPAFEDEGSAYGISGADFYPWYIDAIFLNDKVLVPLYGLPEDEAALEVYRSALPGYEIKGFEFPEDQGLYANTINCRTATVWDTQMLVARHMPYRDEVAAADVYPVEVAFRDYSGAGLEEDRLRLVWRFVGTQEWTKVALLAGDRDDVFRAEIVAGSDRRPIEYYVAGEDRTGRVAHLPRQAPEATFRFTPISRP